MTSILNSVEQTLFFTDVPDGILKPKKKDSSGGGALESIENALFFSDLASVANQSNADASAHTQKTENLSSWSDEFEEMLVSKPSLEHTKKYSKPLVPRSKQPDEMSVQDFETKREKNARGKTFLPPALARQKKLEALATQRKLDELAAQRKKLEEEQHKISVQEENERLRKGQYF